MEGIENTSLNENEQKKEAQGESYNFSDQELIRLLVRSRMSQNQQLEFEDLDGYVMPPRTQFSMINKPTVSIKFGVMTFNMACIRLFETVKYILPLIHPEKKRLTIVTCKEEESASVQWARERMADGKWVNRDITSIEFINKIYKLMEWAPTARYKVLGRIANSREGLVLVFDLDEAILVSSKEVIDKNTGKKRRVQVNYYPEIYKDVIGKSYNEYAASRKLNQYEQLDSYMGQTYSDVEATPDSNGMNENLQETPPFKGGENDAG